VVRLASGERIQQRVVPEKPHEVWTVDFKGWWYTRDQEKVNPLTVRDEYSKFILGIDVAEKGDISHVKAIFERLFKEYGRQNISAAIMAHHLHQARA
jgi:transposase InsO family protein